jgi:hypothetical protein
MTYVSRDPFARQELHKEFIHGAACAFCGQKNRKRSRKSTVEGSYRYEVQSDGGRSYPDRETFCGKSCRSAYSA